MNTKRNRSHHGRSGGRSQRRRSGKPQEPKKPQAVLRHYKVVFCDSLDTAHGQLAELEQQAQDCDQLNIVIRAESDMDDEVLNKVGKVYAGEAWTVIHERRLEEGWYDKPH